MAPRYTAAHAEQEDEQRIIARACVRAARSIRPRAGRPSPQPPLDPRHRARRRARDRSRAGAGDRAAPAPGARSRSEWPRLARLPPRHAARDDDVAEKWIGRGPVGWAPCARRPASRPGNDSTSVAWSWPRYVRFSARTLASLTSAMLTRPRARARARRGASQRAEPAARTAAAAADDVTRSTATDPRARADALARASGHPEPSSRRRLRGTARSPRRCRSKTPRTP